MLGVRRLAFSNSLWSVWVSPVFLLALSVENPPLEWKYSGGLADPCFVASCESATNRTLVHRSASVLSGCGDWKTVL